LANIFFSDVVAIAIVHIVDCRLHTGKTFQAERPSGGCGALDEEFATEFFAGEDPVGKHVNLKLGDTYEQLQIVGIVGHVKQFGLDEDKSAPLRVQLYTAVMQLPDKETRFFGHETGFLLRTSGSPATIVETIRDRVHAFNSKCILFATNSLNDIITGSRSLRTRRFAMILLSIFSGLALVLSSVGVYGVISYVTVGRTREIGLRSALGAQRTDVMRMVVGQGLRLSLAGVGAGLIAASAVTQTMRAILYGVGTLDLPVFAAVAIILTVVAFAASYIPALRAARVDPIVTLRSE
jgi:FtsX-like permease family